MNTTGLLVLNATVIVAVVLLAARKYGTLLTPLTFFGGFWFVATVFAPVLYLRLKLFGLRTSAIDYSILLSVIYFAVLGIVFLLRFSPLGPLLSALTKVSRPFTLQDANDLTGIAIVFLALEFVATYCVLMVASGAGWLWLTNPRDAYSYYRIGSGVWWAMAQADLMLLFLVLLFWRPLSVWKVFGLALIFAAVDLLLGSKATSLSYPIIGMLFANFCVRKTRTRAILLGGVMVFSAALALQLMQGTARTLQDTQIGRASCRERV